MDPNTPPNTEIDSQLRQYREEQKRKHEQLAHESTDQPLSQAPRSPSAGFNVRPPSYVSTPSAPPLEESSEQHPTSSLYPSINSVPTASPLYPNINSRESTKAAQEEEDAKLAKQLQEQEEAEQENYRNTQASGVPSPRPSTRYEVPSPPTDDNDEDEQLAKAIQESEQEQAQNQAQPAPQASGGFLSTLGNIGRGLYNAYNAYSQAHEQTQREAEQNIQEHNAQQLQQRHERHQLESDEALARQLQEEDNERENEHMRQQVPAPRMRPYGQFPMFRFRHAPAGSHLSPFGYDSDEDAPGMSPHALGAQPLDQLRNMNSMFRSMGVPHDEPIFHHLQDLLQRTRNQSEYMQSPLPRQRIVFPGTLFNVQGVEQLPPDLLNMMHGETDTSYESLLELAERMQPVSRGASTQQIDQLPTRTFTAGSMPADQSKCGICLSDYETGDELTSLPCLHSFHKDCVTHWLEINKICPVCRAEIAGAGRT